MQTSTFCGKIFGLSIYIFILWGIYLCRYFVYFLFCTWTEENIVIKIPHIRHYIKYNKYIFL